MAPESCDNILRLQQGDLAGSILVSQINGWADDIKIKVTSRYHTDLDFHDESYEEKTRDVKLKSTVHDKTDEIVIEADQTVDI